jgi:hypothetical protein
LLSVAAFALLVARRLDAGFRDDDWVFLAHVRSAGSWLELLAPSGHFAFYRPGALWLFHTEHALFGLQSGGYLLVNAALHLANAVLGARVLAQFGLSRGAASFAGALFLLGFGHWGKQVAWACASGPLACVGLCLVAMWGVGVLARTSPSIRSRPGVWVGTALALFAAPLFHEAGVMMPVLVGLVLWRSRAAHRTLVWVSATSLPCFAWLLTLVMLDARYPAYLRATAQLEALPLLLLRYPGLLFFPVQEAQWDWAPWIHALLGGACVGLGIAATRRDHRQPAALAAWAYAVLLPFCLVGMPDRWLEPRYLYFAALPADALVALLVLRKLVAASTATRGAIVAATLAGAVAAVGMQIVLDSKYAELARGAEQAGLADMSLAEHDWRLGSIRPR